MGEEAMGWYLATGMGLECYEGGKDSGHTCIHLQAPSNGATVGGPQAHIRSLRVGGDEVRGRGVETGHMVMGYCGRCPTEIWATRYFGRRTGSEATVIRKV